MLFLATTELIKRSITGLILGIGFWVIFIYCPPICFSLLLLLILLLIIIFEWTLFFPISRPTFWALLPLYLIIPFGMLIALNHSQLYRELLFILFILIFSFDTGSYITGSLIGKTPLLEKISPKKTWEGVAGGYICALLGFIFIIFEQQYKVSALYVIIVTLATCTLGLMGDLFESMLKRRIRIKHSGNFLPGHGGLLDRFDGIIFATFFFYFFKDLLISFLTLSP